MELILPLGVFTIMFYLWWTQGRDEVGREIIITRYSPPDNLTPLEVGVIYDKILTGRDVSAEMIYLAQKGYLSIDRQEENGAVDYVLKKLKDDGADLRSFDKILLAALFQSGPEVKIFQLKNIFFSNFQLIGQNVFKSLARDGYYKSSKPLQNFTCFSFLALSLLCISTIVFTDYFVYPWVLSVFASLLIFTIFSIFMSALTKKGVLAKEHILGFKTYLSIAEKARLDFHNAPEKDPEELDLLLPYAMALGVETNWAKQFGEMYSIEDDRRRSRGWYHSRHGGQSFVAEISDFGNKASVAIKGASNK